MIDVYSATNVIAALLGLYMIAGGVGMLTDRDVWSRVIRDIAASPALGYIAGILAFAIGAAIVAVHNRWGTPLEIIVSLIGWAALAEGVLMLALRRPFIGLFARFVPSAAAGRIIAGLVAAAGSVLLYAALL
jgi:uncharacterized membrane protein